MTIVRRLVMTLGMALLALAFVGGYGLFQLNGSFQRIEGLETHTIPGLKSISMTLDDVADMRLNVYRYVVDGIDDASRSAIEKEIGDADKRFDTHVADYQSRGVSDPTWTPTGRTLLRIAPRARAFSKSSGQATRTARSPCCTTAARCIRRRLR
jgi:hypothetical protein